MAGTVATAGTDPFSPDYYYLSAHVDSRGQAILDSVDSPAGSENAVPGAAILGFGVNNLMAIGNASGAYAIVGYGAAGVHFQGFPDGSGVGGTAKLSVNVSFSEAGPTDTWTTLQNTVNLDLDGSSSYSGDPNDYANPNVLCFDARLTVSAIDSASQSFLSTISQEVESSAPGNVCSNTPNHLTAFPYHLSLTFPVDATYNLYAIGIEIDGGADGAADVYAPAVLSFDLAPGVTMETSYLFTDPTNISVPAPEPNTKMLAVTALAALLGVKAREAARLRARRAATSWESRSTTC